ncbi:MAG: GNAT family N-acetyltransferase [Fimbriimonadaceae bacterium]|nr:GNAT family N-acetyltransferase [Fimbriimonadaceae bacterium]
MKWSFEEVTSENEPNFRSVVAWAYSGEPPDDEPAPSFVGLGKRYVGLIDGEGAAVCQVFDFSATRGEADFSLGGIGLVGVHPNHRRSGVGQRMMREVLQICADEGKVMAGLYAFRDPFYRKMQFATCGWVWEITCPVDRMPETGSALPVHQASDSDWPQIAALHERWVRQRSLGVHRTPALWDRRRKQSSPGRYVFGNPAEGYAFVKHGGFWGTIQVGEFVYTTKAAYDTGIALFRSLAINNNEVVWLEPSDSPFLSRHWDYGQSAKREKGSMMRVLDVAGALRSLKPDPDIQAELVISVVDPLFESAKGPWHIKAGGGCVEVKRTNGDPGLTMSIETFTQGFCGDPSWRTLARNGDLQASDTQIKMLEGIAPGMTVLHTEPY